MMNAVCCALYSTESCFLRGGLNLTANILSPTPAQDHQQRDSAPTPRTHTPPERGKCLEDPVQPSRPLSSVKMRGETLTSPALSMRLVKRCEDQGTTNCRSDTGGWGQEQGGTRSHVDRICSTSRSQRAPSPHIRPILAWPWSPDSPLRQSSTGAIFKRVGKKVIHFAPLLGIAPASVKYVS